MTDINHLVRVHAALDMMAADIEDATSTARVQMVAAVLKGYIDGLGDDNATLRQIAGALEVVIHDREGEDIARAGRIGYLLDALRDSVAAAIESPELAA